MRKPSSRRRSEAQMAASRANGARSRGPVTPTGKAVASRNATKHGFYAAQRVGIDRDGEAAFSRLLASVRQRFSPIDKIAEALVVRLARVMWRMECAEALEAQLLSAGDPKRVATSFPVRPFNSLLRQQRELMRAFAALMEQLNLLNRKNCGNEPNAAKNGFNSVCCRAASVMIKGRFYGGYCTTRQWIRGWLVFRSRAGPLPALS